MKKKGLKALFGTIALGVALGMSAGATSTYCTAVYVSTSTAGGGTADTYAINTDTGANMFTAVSGQTSTNAMSLNPVDGYLYWSKTGSTSGTATVWRQKADGSGSPVQVGTITGITSLPLLGGGFDANGNYYAMGQDRRIYKIANIANYSGTANLPISTNYLINSSTLTLSSITNGDVAFDSSGNMWVIVEQGTSTSTTNPVTLAKIDPNTGTILSYTVLKTSTGATLNANEAAASPTGVAGLTIDPVNNSFYVSSSISGSTGILEVNPTTGAYVRTVNPTYVADLGSCPVIPDVPTVSKSFSSTTSNSTYATPSLTITFSNTNKYPIYLYQPLTDTFPSGMTMAPDATVTTTCTTPPTYNATSVTLPANTSVQVGGCSITISKMTVSGDGTYNNVIPSNSLDTSAGVYTSPATATYTVTTPAGPQLKLAKTHTDDFTMNQQGTYTLTVTNVGQSSTTGALTLKDALPAGMQFVSASSTHGTISGAPANGTTGNISFSFTPSAPIAPNETATITLTVLPTQGGTLTNYASVEGGGDPDVNVAPASTCTIDQCSGDSTLVKAPQLTISKSDNGVTFKTSSTGVYYLTVTNTGQVATTAPITVREAFPSGMTFKSITTSNGTVTGGTVNASGTQDFTLTPSAPLQPGQSITLTLSVGVGTATSYTNYVSVGGGGDPDPLPTPGSTCTTDQCGSDTTSTTGALTIYDVQATKTITSAVPTKVGDTVTYTIEVKNLSTAVPATATYFPFEDDLPSNITLTSWSCQNYVSATATTRQSDCTQADGTATRTLTNQTSDPINLRLWLDGSNYGDSSRVTITVTGVVNAAGQTSNTATVRNGVNGTTTYQDNNLSNNSSTATFTIAPAPALSATKTATLTTDANGNGKADTGDVITYAVSVKNTGNVDINNLSVQDSFEGGPATALSCTPTTLTIGSTATCTSYTHSVTAAETSSNGGGDGLLTNTVSATGTPTSGTLNPASATATVNVNQAAPALSISKSVNSNYIKVSPDPANTGTAPLPASQLSPSQLVYTLTVTNTGNASASDVVVTDTLPTGLSFVSANSAADGSGTAYSDTDASAQGVAFNVGTLAAGASQTIYVKANVSVNGNTNQNAFLNTASAVADNVPAVTSSQVRTDVVYSTLFKQVHNLGTSPAAAIPQPAPAWASSGDGLPGEVLEYCIDFYNYSSVNLTNYTVKDVVPASTSYVSGSAVILSGTLSAPGGTYPSGTVGYDAASNTVTASGMTVGAGQSGTMCFRTKIQ